jgi:hypothetical protein
MDESLINGGNIKSISTQNRYTLNKLAMYDLSYFNAQDVY